MHCLIALDARMGQGFVDALRRAWDRGDAVFPVDTRRPGPALKRILSRAGVGQPVADGDALVVATAGTTGEPKYAVLTHAGLGAAAVATSEVLDVDPTFDRWLACLPLTHIAGLSVIIRAVLTDTPVTVHPRFDADAVMSAAKAGATLTSLLPLSYRQIDPIVFRRVLLGGAAAPDLPDHVVRTYDLTETGGSVTYDGRPRRDTVVRTVEGEIWVKGPSLLRIYRDGTDPKSRSGWFATGDRGHFDSATEQLTVLGRAGEMITTDGHSVWPEPLEAALAEHPDVADVAIIGSPDRERGQRVVAIVVPRNPATPPTLCSLRRWVKQQMPRSAAPRELRLAEALPRCPLGKLERRGLRHAP